MLATMTSGSCHCGAVRVEVPSAPRWVASCNCSICRRTGALVAYYRPAEVRVEGETATYVTGDGLIRFHHCRNCACHTHWSANPDALAGELPDDLRALLAERMGINARLLDGFEMSEGKFLVDGAELELRYFDNADQVRHK
jgi:hypothetical protein